MGEGAGQWEAGIHTGSLPSHPNPLESHNPLRRIKERFLRLRQLEDSSLQLSLQSDFRIAKSHKPALLRLRPESTRSGKLFEVPKHRHPPVTRDDALTTLQSRSPLAKQTFPVLGEHQPRLLAWDSG